MNAREVKMVSKSARYGLSILLIAMLMISPLVACGPSDQPLSFGMPEEIRDCIREGVDRDQVNLLEWEDPLPDQERFRTYEEILEAIAGEYRVHYKSTDGMLTLSRGEGTPYQTLDRSYHCYKEYYIPIVMELTQGEKTWQDNIHFQVLEGHIGLITGGEAFPTTLLTAASGLTTIPHADVIPSFGAEKKIPKLKQGETRNFYWVTVGVFWNGEIQMSIEANDTKVTKNGQRYFEGTPWFELEGERIDPD